MKTTRVMKTMVMKVNINPTHLERLSCFAHVYMRDVMISSFIAIFSLSSSSYIFYNLDADAAAPTAGSKRKAVEEDDDDDEDDDEEEKEEVKTKAARK